MIPWNMAVELGFDLEQARTIPIVTGNGSITVPLVALESFQVGSITAKNVACICHDIMGLNNAAGLLGLSFLKHVRTLIDYRELLLQID